MNDDPLSNEQQILGAVDKLADALDPDEIVDVAQQLGITVEELVHRITVETMARIAGS